MAQLRPYIFFLSLKPIKVSFSSVEIGSKCDNDFFTAGLSPMHRGKVGVVPGVPGVDWENLGGKGDFSIQRTVIARVWGLREHGANFFFCLLRIFLYSI